MDRRKLLTNLLYAGGAVFSSIVAIPAFLSALSPAIRRGEREAWRSVGKLDAFAVGQVQPAVVEVRREDWSRTLERKTVYVWRREGEEPVVYSRNCTDLSCPVVYDRGSQCFFCPCHGGIFAKDGRPMAGPPQVPLYRYANRVRDGVLEIDLRSVPPMN